VSTASVLSCPHDLLQWRRKIIFCHWSLGEVVRHPQLMKAGLDPEHLPPDLPALAARRVGSWAEGACRCQEAPRAGSYGAGTDLPSASM
jgi:hypothetical protein